MPLVCAVACGCSGRHERLYTTHLRPQVLIPKKLNPEQINTDLEYLRVYQSGFQARKSLLTRATHHTRDPTRSLIFATVPPALPWTAIIDTDTTHNSSTR